MKTKIFVYLLLCSLTFTKLNAQLFTLYGDRTFGGSGEEVYVNISYVGNNRFILSGDSRTIVNGDKTEPNCDTTGQTTDVWILKIDTGFNIIWDKSVGGNKTDNNPFLFITHNNNNLIFSCRSFSDSACQKSGQNHKYPNNVNSPDYWICMIDSNGNKVWDKTIGANSIDEFPCIIELSTGDFMVCGNSISGINGDKTVANYGGLDYWAIKLNNAGNKIWDKVYGGSGSEWTVSGNTTNHNLLACENGGFILGGTTDSPVSGDISDTSRGMQDIWIIKCDSAGNKIWDKRYGGSGYDRCEHITHTNDGGYIICGETNSPQGLDVSQTSRGGNDVWLIKLDALGNKQWDKRYGGNRNDYGVSVQFAPDGGYWVSGSTNSDSSGEVTEPNYGVFTTYDYWIFKTDSVGNKLWDKRFGAAGLDQGSNFVIMPDSSIYLFGFADSGTSAVKTDAGNGGSDYWLVHFKYTDSVTVGVNELAGGSWQLAVVPNPAKDVCTITLSNTSTLQHHNTLTLYDIMGRALLQQTLTSSPHHLITSSLAKGVYIVEVKDKEGRSVKGKLVKD